MDSKTNPPAPVERPRFATWLHARGLVPADVAAVCGVGREQVRRYCLPFADAMNVTPPRHVIEAVFDYTKGEITAADWYPERVTRPAAEAVGAVQ